ncbi:MAG: triphosphoribosyl-dephospho-CoA synthase [Gemmataceae bacterium]
MDFDNRNFAAAQDSLRDFDGMMVATACVWEVTARKVGNVHPKADFKNTSYMDFLLSAVALGEFHTQNSGRREARWGLGRWIDMACFRMGGVIRSNTNLGMILLLEPLCLPLPQFQALTNPPSGGVYDLRKSVRELLSTTTVEDAEYLYEAIRRAAPGGLGDAPEQDVREEPTVTLLEAMKLAADRDLIARQYANGFADVFDLGVPAFLEAFARFGCVEAAVIDCQLRWMAAFPDSLIARKCGPDVAADVQQRVEHVLELGGLETPEGRAAGVALDRHLRSDGNKLNPGTTADLVTACLFVALREGKIPPSAPFRWNTPDWL